MRTPSAYTLAIRQLLDQHNGELSHSQIRPLLKKLGHDVAEEPANRRSDGLAKFEEYACDLNDPESIAAVVAACGFDKKTAEAVVAEAQLRAAFKAERNNFDVTKYHWAKNRESGTTTVSRKPVSSKNTKAKTAKGSKVLPKPKHHRDEASDPLDVVKKVGGVAAARQKIAALNAEAAALQSAVDAVVELQERIAAAA